MIKLLTISLLALASATTNLAFADRGEREHIARRENERSGQRDIERYRDFQRGEARRAAEERRNSLSERRERSPVNVGRDSDGSFRLEFRSRF